MTDTAPTPFTTDQATTFASYNAAEGTHLFEFATTGVATPAALMEAEDLVQHLDHLGAPFGALVPCALLVEHLHAQVMA